MPEVSLTRRELITGAAAVAALTALPKPADAQFVIHAYSWTGLPPQQPGLVQEPWNSVWVNVPSIGWNVNPPTSQFFHELKHWTEQNPGWHQRHRNLEDLLTAFHTYKYDRERTLGIHDPRIAAASGPDVQWFRQALQNNFNFDPAHSLASVIALAGGVAAIAAGAGTVVWAANAIAQGVAAGNLGVQVALVGGGLIGTLGGLTLIGLGLYTMYWWLHLGYDGGPKTIGWPIPDGYNMALPRAGWFV